MIGKTLAHYEILAHLGSGGMGEVYRARDTKLGREVALKTLLPELFNDPERIARFEREARSLATLQHGNVASIYGWEETPEARFLVMELVEGEELSERIRRGAVPVADAVAITAQICDGLAAAHEKGLVHRDLKPANIMLTRDGQVKILDFGLARAWAGDGDEADPTTSPTITAAMTMAGTILGTAAYMSPEQARGRTADRRADIWATGVILWEMLTGRQLFAGETVTDTLAAVLTRDLGLDALPAGVSPAVRRGLARCLARDAKERLHDINDLRLELMAGVDEPDPAATTGGGSRGLPRWLVPVLMVLVAVAAVAGMRFGHDSVQVPPVPVVRQVIAGAGFNGWSLSALSPDGQTVAWVPISLSGTEPIVLRRLDEFGERRLVGTEDASNPTFSPDSRWLAYLKIGERVLYKVPVEGGAPQRLADCDMMATHIEWADDGYIYFSGGGSNATDRGVHRVPEAGGPRETIVPVTDEETQTYHALRVPGTDWLVYTAETTGSERLSAMNLANGERRALGIQGSSPQFLPPDILLWFRNSGSEVMASRIDPATLTLRGDAFSVLTQVPAATMLRGCYEISRNGTLIFNRSTSGGLMAARRALSFVDRNGRMTPVFPEEASWAQPRVSPDGRHILVREVRTPNCVLWNYDLARGTRVRITVDEDAHNPLWNPVTGGIIFRYDLGSTFIVAERRPDGTGETRPLYQQEKIEVAPTSISRDGRWLLVNALTNGRDVWAIDLEQGGEPIPFITSGFREQNGAMSPDNRWVAYDSDESGREEVYVISWPDGRNRVQISVEGGHDPSWSHDGRTLYFLGERQVMSVGVTPGANLDPGLPEPAFTGPVDDATYNHAYDVMPDGERAVWIAVSAAGEAKADLWVVSGWGGEVRAKLGAR